MQSHGTAQNALAAWPYNHLEEFEERSCPNISPFPDKGNWQSKVMAPLKCLEFWPCFSCRENLTLDSQPLPSRNGSAALMVVPASVTNPTMRSKTCEWVQVAAFSRVSRLLHQGVVQQFGHAYKTKQKTGYWGETVAFPMFFDEEMKEGPLESTRSHTTSAKITPVLSHSCIPGMTVFVRTVITVVQKNACETRDPRV